MNLIVKPMGGGNSTNGVVRIGDTIHRPAPENGEYVHQLLRHLYSTGFRSAPRFEGIDDQGREVLSYIKGNVPHNVKDIPWSSDQLSRVTKLLKDFHDATAGAVLAGDSEVVCHNDFAPWNVVFVDDMPVAIIDFDDAAPGTRLRDLSYAIWCWLGLGSDAFSIDEQRMRIRRMCNDYGVKNLAEVISEITERQQEILTKFIAVGNQLSTLEVKKDISWLRDNKAALIQTWDSRQ